MKFGLIGAGVIAEYHSTAIRSVPGAELVGVYDKFEDARKTFAERHRILAYSSIQDLVRKGGAEVVLIGTPSGWHLEPAVRAMEAGAHVLCEKPLEVTVEGIDRMTEVSKKTGKKLGAILQIRTFPDCRRAKEILDRGDLGKLLVADALIKYYRTQGYYESASWRGTYELDGGGSAMNQGIHWIDLISWLVGGAEWVEARCGTLSHKIEVEDTCHAVIGWRDGAQGIVETTTCAYPGFPTRIEIHGEKGSLLLEDSRIQRLIVDDEESTPAQVFEEDAGGHADPTRFSVEGHIEHVRDMIGAIEENRPPMVPPDEARKSVNLVTSLYRSSREQRRICIE